jgi:hypothetical protein
MVAGPNRDQSTERAYQVVRGPADGLACALSVAEKHRLSRDAIEQRLKS